MAAATLLLHVPSLQLFEHMKIQGTQVNMVSLATKLDQFTAPCRQDLRKRTLEVIPQFFMQAWTPILGHENNMQLDIINRVRA